MRSLSKRPLLLVLAVALAQTMALGWMVYGHAMLIAHGREILLDVTPVDPRSLFRGDYVTLTYPAAMRPVDDLTEADRRAGGIRTGYLMLEKPAGASVWQSVRASLAKPTPAADQVVIRGSIDLSANWIDNSQIFVRPGIGAYFVPEGEGRRIERSIRDGSVQVIVAVDEEGNAGIKGIVIEGKRIYDEPLL
ncbi:MAG: GDYXXLXY domain-containing protein [Hyphomicrobiaceae bacterium]